MSKEYKENLKEFFRAAYEVSNELGREGIPADIDRVVLAAIALELHETNNDIICENNNE